MELRQEADFNLIMRIRCSQSQVIKLVAGSSARFLSTQDKSGPERVQRALHPPLKFRAAAGRRVTVKEPEIATDDALTVPAAQSEGEAELLKRHESHRVADLDAPSNKMDGMNETEIFLEHVQLQSEQARFERNQSIPLPTHPDELVPEFRRLKRHQKHEVVARDPIDDRPVFKRRDVFVTPPPSPAHPWLGRSTPIGDHVVHGDGQLNLFGGTGKVGFDDDERVLSKEEHEKRLTWRGLSHRSPVHHSLPLMNAVMWSSHSPAVVKHSFSLTGRGVFASKAIKKGETIMITSSTARSLGVKGEMKRLEEMCTEVLLNALDKTRTAEEQKEYVDFLHNWILTGQPSSLVEYWPQASTDRVLEAIGGQEQLDLLELHPIHITRMAAIMDLNGFLVESTYAERKGMAYFPEAGFFNHSCVPNAAYEIMPEHVFEESDYYLDEALKEEEAREEGTSHTAGSSSAAAPSDLTPAEERAQHRLARFSQGSGNELTEYGAPTYLFCCRADKDIAEGEEILISYVPPDWSFDNRQYVLHDRYHFYCKCPRCVPTIERQYAKVPKLLVFLVVCSIILQIFLICLKNNAGQAAPERAPEDEEEFPRPKRMGFFELMEKQSVQTADSYPGSERLPSHITDNYARK